MQPPIRRDSIVLVGASVRAAAQSAQRAGFNVIGVDLFADTDTKLSCDRVFQIPNPPTSGDRTIGEILAACADLPILAVGGLDGQQRFLDQLYSVGHRIGPSAEILASLRQRARLGRVAAATGIETPASIETDRADLSIIDPIRIDRQNSLIDGQRWLAKRIRSSGGLGVQWWNGSERRMTGTILERWIAGRLFGATYLSDGEHAELVGVCRSMFTRKFSRPFVYAGSVGPIGLPTALVAKLHRLGRALVDEFQLSGQFNADLIIDRDDQIWLLEVNPRWSGSSEILELAIRDRDECDPVASLIGLVVAKDADRSIPTVIGTGERVWIKRILYAKRDQRFRRARFDRALAANQSLHDIPMEGTPIRRGEPLLTLITMVCIGDRRAIGEYRTARVQMQPLD